MGAIATLLLVCAVGMRLHAQENFADLAARAEAARQANDTTTAIRLYREALKQKADWREGWWTLGFLSYGARNFAESAEALRALVKLSPGAGPGWALLGLSEYETRDYGVALNDLQRGISIGMGNLQQMEQVVRFHEAALLTWRGDFDGAMERYAALVTGPVRDEQLLCGLGLMNLRRRLTPEEVDGREREMVLLAGQAEGAQLNNERPAAEAAYASLLQRFPDQAGVHFAYGYYLLGSAPDQAMEQWRRALDLDAKFGPANAMLGWTLWLRGEKREARQYARLAVEQNPMLVAAQIVLGRLLVESGEKPEGLTHLEAAEKQQPNNFEVHLALATAYSESGRKQDAQRERRWCLDQRAGSETVAVR